MKQLNITKVVFFFSILFFLFFEGCGTHNAPLQMANTAPITAGTLGSAICNQTIPTVTATVIGTVIQNSPFNVQITASFCSGYGFQVPGLSPVFASTTTLSFSAPSQAGPYSFSIPVVAIPNGSQTASVTTNVRVDTIVQSPTVSSPSPTPSASPSPSATPSPSPSPSASPVAAIPTPVLGNIDGVVHPSSGNYLVSGWACMTGANQSIHIQLFAGGPYGKGAFLGDYIANMASEPQVAQACQAGGTRYRFAIPLSLPIISSFSGQSIYVHAISPIGQPNYLLVGSGNYTIPIFSGSIIFTTSMTFSGNLNGMAGADKICNDLAAKQGLMLGHPWVALIAGVDLTGNALALVDRVPSVGPFWNSHSERIADTRYDLFNTTLQNTMSYDETGAVVATSGAADTWTGSGVLGGAIKRTCANWTSSLPTGLGTIGASSELDYWTTDNSVYANGQTISCNANLHLYCISH